MSYKIITADNQTVEVECIGCALVKKEVEVIGGFVKETDNFTVSQDFEIPIPGFMILASKKHKRSFIDFTQDENKELIHLLGHTRKAMSKILSINSITMIQQEKSENSHFHIWLFPWYAWMQDLGSGLKDITKIMEYARANLKTEENLKTVKESCEKLKQYSSF